MPTGSSSRSGAPPKPPDKRRNRTKPANWGLAEPVKAGRAATQPELSFTAHPAVARLWEALGKSVESRFFSAADWERANLEMLFIHETLTNPKGIPSIGWQTVQNGLNALLVSPAEKRRAGIELKGVADVDEEAAVLQIAEYQEKLV